MQFASKVILVDRGWGERTGLGSDSGALSERDDMARSRLVRKRRGPVKRACEDGGAWRDRERGWAVSECDEGARAGSERATERAMMG